MTTTLRRPLTAAAGVLAILWSWAPPTRGDEPLLRATVTQSEGTCVGGVPQGMVCTDSYQCYGKCAGGKVPGEECISTNIFWCQGACSGNANIRCGTNTDCSLALAGTCTNPPRGTCTNPPPGVCQGAFGTLAWPEVPGATGYDVLSGGLNTLRSELGNFHHATCLANNTTATSIEIGAGLDFEENPSWYLVRAVFGATNGTWDEGGNQVASRDLTTEDCP